MTCFLFKFYAILYKFYIVAFFVNVFFFKICLPDEGSGFEEGSASDVGSKNG